METKQAIISIHATHTGGDGDFLSIHELWIDISIHATHTGGDHALRANASIFYISIHATHTGGDDDIAHVVGFRSNFNPRHPYGWRRNFDVIVTNKKDFNPRHPYGWRREKSLVGNRTILFQSTPPIRVATDLAVTR